MFGDIYVDVVYVVGFYVHATFFDVVYVDIIYVDDVFFILTLQHCMRSLSLVCILISCQCFIVAGRGSCFRHGK